MSTLPLYLTSDELVEALEALNRAPRDAEWLDSYWIMLDYFVTWVCSNTQTQTGLERIRFWFEIAEAELSP